MKIRKFKQADLQAIIDLWTSVFNDNSAHNNPAATIAEKLAVQPELFFVGVKDDQLIATINVGYDGHRGWLYNLAIDANYRRLGLGSLMVEHAVLVLKQLGCTKVNLQVRADNHLVEAFYQKLGFVTEPRISMGKIL